MAPPRKQYRRHTAQPSRSFPPSARPPRRTTFLVNEPDSESESDEPPLTPRHPRSRNHTQLVQPTLSAPAPTLARLPVRRALLIGYSDTEPGSDVSASTSTSTSMNSDQFLTLRAHTDVEVIQKLLIERFGYRDEDIVIMLDRKGVDARLRPRKGNIERQIRRLVKNAAFGDHFFFFYAGHGTQQTCCSGTESDGKDEFIVCEKGKLIKDNRLNRLLVKPLPPGSHLFALFDACFTGSVLDLPHHACNHTRAHDGCVSFNIALFVVYRARRLVIRFRATAFSRGATQPTPPPPPPPGPPLSPRPQRGTRLRTPLMRAGSFIIPDTPPSSPITATAAPISFPPSQHAHPRGAATTAPGGYTAEPAKVTASVGRCTGLCPRPSRSDDLLSANVVCLAAANDSQYAYETSTAGGLVTAAFVEHASLPEQRLGSLVHAVTVRCVDADVERFDALELNQRYAARLSDAELAKWKQQGPDLDDPLLGAPQRPVLSSLRPMDMTVSLSTII